jgi:GGDEF domain-containing protein
LKNPFDRFSHLSIAKKILLGYLVPALLSIVIALFALSRLSELNRFNQSIIQNDIPLAEISEKMVETVLAQEFYARRWTILRSSEQTALFWDRSGDLQKLLEQMAKLPNHGELPIDQIRGLHTEYNDSFRLDMEKAAALSPTRAKKPEQAARGKEDELVHLLRGISLKARQDQYQKSRRVIQLGNATIRDTISFCIVGALLGFILALGITRNISVPLAHLKRATREISEGKFDHLSPVKRRDELGDLSQAFGEMARRLKELGEMDLDASPLTHLPGGVAVEKTVQKRLAEKTPLAFCLLDLSNFKAYNDRYGYAGGNEAIQATARIIARVVGERGAPEDFIGHIGGDDFVVITTPDRYEAICRGIIDGFDLLIPDFYAEEDRRRGYLEGKNRQGEEVAFRLMTVAIAVVTNQTRRLTNYIQVGEIAAELKDYAKTFPRSAYVVDQRRDAASRFPEKPEAK